MLTFKKQVKVTEYNFLQWHDSIDKYQNQQIPPTHFCAFFFHIQRNLITFYLKKADQGHVVQFRKETTRWEMSKSTSVSYTFSLTLLPFQSYNNFKLRASQIRSSLMSTIFVITPFYGKCQSTEMYHTHSYAISYRLK